MYEENNKKNDLTGALKAIESNNVILSPEEKQKRRTFVEEEARGTSASLIRPLRTFESDAADAISQGKQSIYSLSKAEKKKKEKKKAADPEKEEVKRNGFLLLLSGVLFLAGGAFLLYFLLLRVLIPKPTQQQQNTPLINSLIVSQYEDTINDATDTGNTIMGGIRNIVTKNPRNKGSFENIDITANGQKVPIGNILLELSPSIPASLVRAFDPQNYMVGAVQEDSKDPFFIVKIDYYDNAFAGMLQWENALGTMFAGLDGNTTASSSFQDVVVKNRDTRTLEDTFGNTYVLYSFYNPQTLIITTGKDAFSDIVSGLDTAQLAR